MRRGRRELWERICRLLFALYPPSFRRRCDSDRHRLLGDLLDAEPDRIGAARRARRVALDAAATLPRAWWTAGMDAARVGAVGANAAVAGLGGDAWFALRAASRRPLHAVVVVGTLGLAIGGNAAIYSVAHAALFETLPYAGADRIMSVEGSRQGLLEYTGAGVWRPSETLGEPEWMPPRCTSPKRVRTWSPGASPYVFV